MILIQIINNRRFERSIESRLKTFYRSLTSNDLLQREICIIQIGNRKGFKSIIKKRQEVAHYTNFKKKELGPNNKHFSKPMSLMIKYLRFSLLEV